MAAGRRQDKNAGDVLRAQPRFNIESAFEAAGPCPESGIRG
jgi:hypothetical protein